MNEMAYPPRIKKKREKKSTNDSQFEIVKQIKKSI